MAGYVLLNSASTTTRKCDFCPSVSIEIINDVAANEVTFRFSSDTVSTECVYSDAFADGDFVYAILPDTGNGDDDNFYIHNITLSSSVLLLCPLFHILLLCLVTSTSKNV